MNNELTFDNALLLDDTQAVGADSLLDNMFLVALGSFVFAATYFLGTLL